MYIFMRPGLRVSGLGDVGHQVGQDIQPAGAGATSLGPKLSKDEGEIRIRRAVLSLHPVCSRISWTGSQVAAAARYACTCGLGAMWRWQVPDLSVSPFRRAVSASRNGNGGGAAWITCKTSGDQHLGIRIDLLVSCLEASSLPALPAWTKRPRSWLWLKVQPCLAGSHGRTALLRTQHSTREARRDSGRVCDEPESQRERASQKRCDSHRRRVAQGRATSRGCVCVLPPAGSRHDLATGRRSSCRCSSFFALLLLFLSDGQSISL